MKASIIRISLLSLLLLSIQKPCQATITIIVSVNTHTHARKKKKVTLVENKETNDTLVDRIAAFGPRIDAEVGLSGNLIAPPEGDIYGCKVIQSPSRNDNWIALVERGQCSFLQKVKSMQDSGAIAVVVGDRHFNGWVTMYAPGKRN